MPKQNDQKVIKRIQKNIAKGMSRLPPHLRKWVKLHLVDPKKITFFTSLRSRAQGEGWIVTDNTGIRDSGYRVIYNEELDMFGLIVNLEGGGIYCLGLYGKFDEAIEGM